MVNNSFVGRVVEQVQAELPECQHFVGRRSAVVCEFTDEKGQVHVQTVDGVWCPARLVKEVV